jgi:hypothetical protein
MKLALIYKKSLFLFGCIFICSISLNAQKWASFLGDKLSPLDSGKGFIISDFNHFKHEVIGQMYPSSLEEIGDDALDSLKIKADTLRNQLLEKGMITLNESEVNMLPYFNIYANEDIVLANLVFTINRLGGVKSLNYEVKKGDTLTIVYRISSGAGFDEIEIIEGKEVRLNLNRNKKNKEIRSTLIAAMDGAIAINLTNRGVLRSKGKLLITKKAAQKKIAFKYQCDTIFNQVKVKHILHDTLVEALYNQSLSIPSSADITKNNKLKVQINFGADKNYFAWAYWIGTNTSVRHVWDLQVALNATKDPLATYLRQELSKNGFVPLPEEKHPDIKFSIEDSILNTLRTFQGIYKGDELTTPSFNSRNNYAAYKINNPNHPFGLSMQLKNNSTLYNYNVLLNVVGLYTNSYETEEEVTEKTCQEYIILSVL